MSATVRPMKDVVLMLTILPLSVVAGQGERVPRFGLFEHSFGHARAHDNPYAEVSATAELTAPDGMTKRTLPLFWDGGTVWKLRFSPNVVGLWRWSVISNDTGLNGQKGSFEVVASNSPGGIRPMAGHSHHFERQNGEPFWFMGDTAWALYTDSAEEEHTRAAAEKHIDARAAQGFNVFHSMLLSEAGWGNSGGSPFDDLGTEKINPAYWQEIDGRLAYLNGHGLVGGLVLAWGSKRGREPFAWREFPSREARLRYARYIAARYSAFDVYFIVAGEWHAERRTRQGVPDDKIFREFVALGDAVREADPHDRMIAIHPMTKDGSVREFVDTKWMSFGDYQQNYRDLHGRALRSRTGHGPVVNSEYAYYLRDQSGNGKCDKPNSATLDTMRHATWDLVMAGAYVVTGFGSTYFGGNRHPGPFNVDDPRNDVWEEQIQHVRELFTRLEWWKLEPHDELLSAPTPRSKDRRVRGVQAPPETAYWALAEPGRQYVVYVRGIAEEVRVALPGTKELRVNIQQLNPRTGERKDLGQHSGEADFTFSPPNQDDWIVVLTAPAASRKATPAR